MGFLLFLLFLVIVALIICAIWSASLTPKIKVEAKQREEYEKTKDSKLLEQQRRYDQYCLDYEKLEMNAIGKNPPKSYKLQTIRENGVFRTSDNRFVIATWSTPVKPYEDKSDHFHPWIRPAMPGKFVVNHSYIIGDIFFWMEKGSLQYTSNVSGGGVNVGGAVAGALIAGDVGAIIGSREAISTKTETHDSREIVLKLKTGEEIKFPIVYREAFVACIPEKEYTVMQMNNQLQ